MRLPLEPSPYILLGMLGMLGLACSNASPRSEPGAPALLVMQAPPPSSAASEVPSPAAPERVSVELFVMSRCPFGTRAEQSWAEAVRRLGNVDLRISFVGTVGPNGELRSMRGPSELTGDAAQICAMKHSHQWLAMIDCQNRSPSDIDFNWRECAADLAMPLEDIEACTFGTEAKTLLAQSFEYGISRGVKASPTIFIADREYKGGRSARELIAAVCEASTVKPAVCSTLATTPEVPVTALFDKRCTGCDIPRADGDPLAAVLNPRLTTLDYQTPEGRTLFDTVQPKGSPFYVFGPELDGDPLGLALVEGRLDTTTERRVLVDGTWNPRCADPGGCAHPVCKLSPPCRREQPRRVDLYLEDSSPLSNLALRALDQVVQSFDRKKSTLTFAVHQIAT
ncbi:MAG: hypothetical protein JNK04_25645, partial [Myxococcales bacterium]|nr:hypothetical protein [Myxococcales bacterium]